MSGQWMIFAAVDSGDKEKILAQFAPNVRKNNKDLEENLNDCFHFIRTDRPVWWDLEMW